MGAADVPVRKPFLERNAERARNLVVLGAEACIRRGSRDGRNVYFDPGQFPWTRRLEAGWRDMRAELDRVLLERERIPAFEEVSEEQRSITDDRRWKVFVFHVFGRPVARNCAACPRTSQLLAQIPGLRNAMFSVLAPGKRIPEHRGVYAGLIRYHLALKVPARAHLCVLTVAGQSSTWAEGRTLLFDDSFPHSVCNDTDEERVVLFADFVRPLPFPMSVANRAVLAMLARSSLFQAPLAKFERGEL